MQDTHLESPAPEILLIGGSGFVGSIVAERFVALGWRVRLLTRTIRPYYPSFPCQQHAWDGTSIPREAIEGVRAVINLAGQPIFDRAWTKSYRQLVLDSRLRAGLALAEVLEELSVKPAVVIQISGTDFYGMEPRDEICDEGSEAGHDFMADVGRAHEEAARKIAESTRVCIARMGLVLGWEGGGLPQLWDVYASGCGGMLGNGRQWMNWVHVDDVASFFVEAVASDSYSGIYNLVAPDNATNREFHHQLCEHTRSLRFLAAPKLYLKAMMGKRANFLLQAPKVATPRASDHGFSYQYPDLRRALTHLVGERRYPKAHCVKVKQWLPIAPSEWPPSRELSAFESQSLCSIWHHQQRVQPVADGVLVEDRIEFELRLFPLGELALWLVRKRLHEACHSRRESMAKLVLERSSLPVDAG